jgi:protein-S-isoprenylcysteine O-methyltransferase Ste14
MSQTIASPTTQPNKINRYGINAVARHQVGSLMIAGLVFLGAGTLDWSWAWVFGVVYFICWLILSVALWRYNPDLLNQRGKRASQLGGTKSWDWVLLTLYSIVFVAQPFIAGLDYRYGWSTPSAPAMYLFGNVLMLLAYGLLAWAMVVNRNFEVTVRIQEQRGHQVTTSGPYQYVRHPGYVSVILTFLALPIALGTWTALIPGLIGIVIFVIRTALEDRTLQAELPGYADYAQKTHYRLLPGVW